MKSMLWLSLSVFCIPLSSQNFPTLQWSYDIGAPAFGSAAAADLDGDGKQEYVIGGANGTIRALNVEDEALEVVYNNNDYETFDSRIGVLDRLTGQLEWSYPVDFSAFRGMAVSDINGNGKPDLISGHFLGEVIAVEPFSGLIWKTDLSGYFNPGLPWFDVDHGPLVAEPRLPPGSSLYPILICKSIPILSRKQFNFLLNCRFRDLFALRSWDLPCKLRRSDMFNRF